MAEAPDKEWLDSLAIVARQMKETVEQNATGVTVRRGTITCPCGRERGITQMYQCLYCKVWFCQSCAEQHFGKTVAEYKAEKAGANHD